MKAFAGAAILVLSLVLSSFSWFDSVDDVAAAMKAGNADQLSRFFDARVDLKFPDKSDNYSKAQAAMIMKDFFATNQSKSFIVKHKGQDKDGSQYFIGRLQTTAREYETRFFMKKIGEEQFIQEIVFEIYTSKP